MSCCKKSNAQDCDKNNVQEITDLIQYLSMLEIYGGKH